MRYPATIRVGVLLALVALCFAALPVTLAEADGWEERVEREVVRLEEKLHALDGKTAVEGSLLERVKHLDARLAAIESTRGLVAGALEINERNLMSSLTLAVVKLSGRVRALEKGPDEDPKPPATKKPSAKWGKAPGWAKVSKAQIAEATRREVPVAFQNRWGMRFVLIPAGRFWMGSPPGEPGRVAENEMLHEVELTAPFYMQITEVTNGEFRKFRPGHKTRMDDIPTQVDGDRQPVGDVAWRDAAAFATWLSTKDGARSYRLPTEAEWEYACRAGTRTMYWSGQTEADLDRVAWTMRNTPPRNWTRPVGRKPANPWGLHDMHGNQAEWCRDYAAQYPVKSLRRVITDPMGPPSGDQRTFRGGTCGRDPHPTGLWLRSAARGAIPGGRAFISVGFRLVADLPEPGERGR